MSTLTDYISQNLAQGFPLDAIKSQLSSSGYAPRDINAAVDYVMASRGYGYAPVPAVSPGQPHPHAKIIWVFVGFALILAIVSVFIIFSDATPSVTPRDRVPPKPVQLQPGNITTPKPLISQNASATHGVNTSPGGRITKPVNTTGRVPGNQTVAVNGSTPTPLPGTPQVILSRKEIDLQVEAIAAENPDDAVLLCDKILTVAGKDACAQRVAVLSKDAKYCDRINDVKARDVCLLSFPIDGIGDVTLCAMVSDDVRRESCIQSYEYVFRANIVPVPKIPSPSSQVTIVDASDLFEDIPQEVPVADEQMPVDESAPPIDQPASDVPQDVVQSDLPVVDEVPVV